MTRDAHGGGLTSATVVELAQLLDENWSVVASTDDHGAIAMVTVTSPDGRGGVIRMRPAGRDSLASVEWWCPHYDPNGSPWAWTSFDSSTSDGAVEAAGMLRSGRPGRH